MSDQKPPPTERPTSGQNMQENYAIRDTQFSLSSLLWFVAGCGVLFGVLRLISPNPEHILIGLGTSIATALVTIGLVVLKWKLRGDTGNVIHTTHWCILCGQQPAYHNGVCLDCRHTLALRRLHEIERQSSHPSRPSTDSSPPTDHIHRPIMYQTYASSLPPHRCRHTSAPLS